MGAGLSADKREGRRQCAPEFSAAIASSERRRAQKTEAAGADAGGGGEVAVAAAVVGGGLRVVCRKRPLFEHEAAACEIDVVHCGKVAAGTAGVAADGPAEAVTVYECRLPLGVGFDGEMQPHSFGFDRVFGEAATNDEVRLPGCAICHRLLSNDSKVTAAPGAGLRGIG